MASRSRRSNAGNRMQALIEDQLKSGLLKMGDEEQVVKESVAAAQDVDDVNVDPVKQDYDFIAQDEQDVFDSDFDSTDDEEETEEGYYIEEDEHGNKKVIVTGTRKAAPEHEDETLVKRAKKKKKLDDLISRGIRKQHKNLSNRTLIAAEPQRDLIPSPTTETPLLDTKKVSFRPSPQRQSHRSLTVASKNQLESKMKETQERRAIYMSTKKNIKKEKVWTQEDLLYEAMHITEPFNLESLDRYREMEQQGRNLRTTRKTRMGLTGPIIRYTSCKRSALITPLNVLETTPSTLSLVETSHDIQDTPPLPHQESIPESILETESSIQSSTDAPLETTEKSIIDPIPFTDAPLETTEKSIIDPIPFTDAPLETSEKSIIDPIPFITDTLALTSSSSVSSPLPESTLIEQESTRIPTPSDELVHSPIPPDVSLDASETDPESVNMLTFLHFQGDPFADWRTSPYASRLDLKTCPITGLTAKYRCPKTGVPYRSLEAYKVLQDLLAHKYAWSSYLGVFGHKLDTPSPRCLPSQWVHQWGIFPPEEEKAENKE